MRYESFLAAALLALVPRPVHGQYPMQAPQTCQTTKAAMADAGRQINFRQNGQAIMVVVKGQETPVNAISAALRIQQLSATLRNPRLSAVECAEGATELNAMMQAGNAAVVREQAIAMNAPAQDRRARIDVVHDHARRMADAKRGAPSIIPRP